MACSYATFSSDILHSINSVNFAPAKFYWGNFRKKIGAAPRKALIRCHLTSNCHCRSTYISWSSHNNPYGYSCSNCSGNNVGFSETRIVRCESKRDSKSDIEVESLGSTSPSTVECIGTGLDVECIVSSPSSEMEQSRQQQQCRERTSSTSTIDCIGTGLDVECIVSLPSSEKDQSLQQEQYLQEKRSEVTFEMEDAERKGKIFDVTLNELSLLVWDWALLVSPFFFWGTAMVAMKEVLPKVGPFFVSAFRLIPAGLLLVAFAGFRGRKLPSGLIAWLSIALFGLVDASFFQGFLLKVYRGHLQVIIDSQPLTVAVLAALLFDESIGLVGAVGLVLGVVGLLLLEVSVQIFTKEETSSLEEIISLIRAVESRKGITLEPKTLEGSALCQRLNNFRYKKEERWTCQHSWGEISRKVPALAIDSNFSLWGSGEWWMLLAAQSMAVGTIMVRWVSNYSDPVMATGWHMVIGGLPLAVISVLNHDPALSGGLQELSVEDILSLLYTSVFGSAISYGVFFYNATRGSLTKLSSLTFLTPMFASFFGFLYLGETFSPLQLGGALVTVVAIYMVNYQGSDD
ncbi:EamA domain [Dillenia turbinata]|uniref:EamA domain n=1 Tax=Dillenia turbinata TaxID=194707 RepID=A0AAN8URS5_9MAGN